jgi:hypothetical protein
MLATLNINSLHQSLHFPPLNMEWKLQIAGAMRFMRCMCMYIYMTPHDTTTVPWEEPSSTIKPTHYWVLLFLCCCWGGGWERRRGGRGLPYVWECGLVVTSRICSSMGCSASHNNNYYMECLLYCMWFYFIFGNQVEE